MTAGSGSEGAGDGDLRRDGEELKDERRDCVRAGGFIGNASELGVPGADGSGEAIVSDDVSPTNCAREAKSGGAGLFDETRRAGRSIFVVLPC